MLLAALASGLLALATGCAPEAAAPQSSPSASAPSPEESTPSPVPSASPVSFVLPTSCEQLLPIETIETTMDAEWTDAAERPDPREDLPGPAARAAASEASETISCLWWPELATEVYLAGFAFRVEDSTGDRLREGLDGSESYTQAGIEGADASFTMSELRGDLRYTVIYAFVGDLWIALEAPFFEEDITALAEAIVAGIRTD